MGLIPDGNNGASLVWYLPVVSLAHPAKNSWYHLTYEDDDSGGHSVACTCRQGTYDGTCIHMQYFRTRVDDLEPDEVDGEHGFLH